jgi:hypothetical protein
MRLEMKLELVTKCLPQFSIHLQLLYDFPPVILIQIITENEPDAVSGIIRNINRYSFEFRPHGIEKTACPQNQDQLRDRVSRPVTSVAAPNGKTQLFDVISANSHTISAYPEINFDQPIQTNIITKAHVDPRRVLLQLADLLCTRIYWLTMIFAIATC